MYCVLMTARVQRWREGGRNRTWGAGEVSDVLKFGLRVLAARQCGYGYPAEIGRHPTLTV